METIFKVIQNIREFIRYDGGERQITIHAKATMVNEIIDQIKQLYFYADWDWAIKNNKFIFAADDMELSFIINDFIEEGKWKLISSKTYKSVKEAPDLSEFSLLFYYDYAGSTVEFARQIVVDHINFCVANGIKFIVKDDWLFYSKDPYEFIFKRLGVNTDSIRIAGEAATELMKHKIDNLINQYLFLNEISNNKYGWKDN